MSGGARRVDKESNAQMKLKGLRLNRGEGALVQTSPKGIL